MKKNQTTKIKTTTSNIKIVTNNIKQMQQLLSTVICIYIYQQKHKKKYARVCP